jgi:hypothetical protein
MGDAGSDRAEVPPPEPINTSEPVVQTTPPPASAPAPPKASQAAPKKQKQVACGDAKAKLKAKGPADERLPQQQLSLHVSPAAKQLANVASSADSSMGSVGTMEKEWLDVDSNEVASWDGRKGMASMELFFSDFWNLLNATATESSARLNRCENVVTVSFLTNFACRYCYYIGSPRGMGRLLWNRNGFRMPIC